MLYKLTYLPIYSNSLEQITAYMADISSKTAIEFKIGLDQQINILCQLPHLYPIYEYSSNLILPLRKMVINRSSFTVFYMADDVRKEVILYDIIHQSRDIDAILPKTAA